MQNLNLYLISRFAYRYKRSAICTTLLAILLVTNSCQKISQTTEVKLAHTLEVTHPVHRAMVYMADRVREKSGGKMTIDIYPGSQLGSERESIELLQIGSIGMTKVSAAVMESFSPNFKALSLPYVFRDKTHYYDVLDGNIGDDLLKEGEKYWLRGLCFYDAGSRSFYSTKKPIDSPADLRGMTIRVQASNTAFSMIKSFGGAASPVSWGELYTALQQGVVDGAENNPPSFFLSRHYEVSKFYSLNEHTMIPDILLVSTVVWESLTPQEQQWLQEAADESAQVQRELWEEAEIEALQAIRDAGVTVSTPDKAPFAKLVEPMYESFKNEPEVYSLIQRIRQTGNQKEAIVVVPKP